MRQSSDLEFAEILKGSDTHVGDDTREITFLANIGTSHLPDSFVKVYLTNHLAGIENKTRFEKLRTELKRDAISMYAKDSARDVETQNLSVDISDNQIHKTGKLPIKSKLYIEVRVMLTATINTSAHLMSGSTGKIEYM